MYEDWRRGALYLHDMFSSGHRLLNLNTLASPRTDIRLIFKELYALLLATTLP